MDSPRATFYQGGQELNVSVTIGLGQEFPAGPENSDWRFWRSLVPGFAGAGYMTQTLIPLGRYNPSHYMRGFYFDCEARLSNLNWYLERD